MASEQKPTVENPNKDFNQLLKIFQESDTLTLPEITEKIQELGINEELKTAIVESVNGNQRKINDWLFSRPAGYSGKVAWIAPIRVADKETFTWMIGSFSKLSGKSSELFALAHKSTVNDPLLMQTQVTPPLVFLEPEKTSNVVGAKYQSGDGEGGDEFAIFQTGYKGEKAEISDFDQKLVLNSRYLKNYRLNVLERTLPFAEIDPEVVEIYKKNAELFAIIHSEGHNQGHFTGAWPFDDLKKKSVLYEAIEEYRSCLVSLQMFQYMGFSEKEKEAYALAIFLTRFLGYGLDAYGLETHKRETVREVTLGSMFLQDMLDKGAVIINKNENGGGNIKIDTKKLQEAMLSTLSEIHEEERIAKSEEGGVERLKESARKWYKRAFPDSCYSEEVMLLYGWATRKG